MGAAPTLRRTPGSPIRPTTAGSFAATVRPVMNEPLATRPPIARSERREPSTSRPRRRLSPSLRRAVLTAHIIASVGLLGDCMAIVAINVRAATTADPDLAASAYELLEMFSILFGIPLSLASLATGLALGLGSKWGVLRYRWVTAKLALNVSVILAGALVIGPSTAAMRAGDGGAETTLILAGAYDVLALALATGLSVYKPGTRRSGVSRLRPGG